MKPKSILAALVIALVAPLAWAGAPGAQQRKSPAPTGPRPARNHKAAPNSSAGQNAMGVSSGTQISARLLTTLDAKKAKPGQGVIAKVTRDVKQNGRTLIHKNARLVGHIVSAQASGKGSIGSQVDVAFDRLIQGKTSTALSAVVTSITSIPRPLSPEPMNMPQPMEPAEPPMGGGRAGRGGLLGGVMGGAGSAVGGTLNSGVNAAGEAAGAGMNAAGNIDGGAMAGADGILVSNSVTGSGSDSAARRTSKRPAGASPRNPARGISDSLTGSGSGSASAGISKSLAGSTFGASGNESNQTAASSIFSRPKGNLQLQSGTQLQLQVVNGAQTRNPATH